MDFKTDWKPLHFPTNIYCNYCNILKDNAPHFVFIVYNFQKNFIVAKNLFT